MVFLKKISLPFSVLLGIGLAITIPLFLAVFTSDSSSNTKIYIIVLLAVGVSVGASTILIIAYRLIVVDLPKLLKWIMALIVLKVVKSAVESQTGIVQASSIASIENDVVIGLSAGLQDGVFLGQRFVVFNTAKQEKWGVLQVLEVRDDSCVCFVFDRTNLEFWNSLERRMRCDASPPQGITIRREIPEESLYEWLNAILRAWGR